MIKEAIAKVVERKDLTEDEMVSVMREIMDGEATPSQISSFITALRMKGETVDEITGAARVMREKSLKVTAKDPVVVDTCGTGGDESFTFNISTAAAFVVAGAGVTVAKHGNRSVSSRSGSADVLRTLGVKIEAEVEKVEECLDAIGIGFLFAPIMHGAMRHAVGPRGEIGIRTIFNILGPLTNPAGARYQLMGVYRSELTEMLAQVLSNLGSIRAFVVSGNDGLDEITLTTETKVSELKDGAVNTYYIKPEDFGMAPCKPFDLVGGESDENARVIRRVLSGEKGPKRDVVVLNAAAAIAASGKARDIKDGIPMAEEAIDSGKALEKLERLIEITNR
jgi:anthranilate phosphoribosyltransferase